MKWWEKIKIIYEWALVIFCIEFFIVWVFYFLPAIGNWWNNDNMEEVNTSQYIGH